MTLTEWENHRLESEHQSALTVKIFLFQFMNNYGSPLSLLYSSRQLDSGCAASLFYIAFFKGRFTGVPGNYNYFFGFRQDEWYVEHSIGYPLAALSSAVTVRLTLAAWASSPCNWPLSLSVAKLSTTSKR